MITFVGILFAWIFYTESLPSRQKVADESMSMRLLGSTATPRQSTSSRYRDTKAAVLGDDDESAATHRNRHRHSSTLSMSSDTDTLVGSPTVKEEGDKSYAVFDDIDELGLGDEDEHDALTRSSEGSRPATVPFEERKEWGFWDLMRYRPVQILCMTMFANQ